MKPEYAQVPAQTPLFPEESLPGGKTPVLISACFLGFPCRWHGRPAKRRDKLIKDLKKKYVLVPVCPEQLGGMPTPRTSETLCGHTGAEVLDGLYRIIAPETGEDVTRFHVNGSRYVLNIARTVGAERAYLKGGSPTCDKEGVTGELLSRNGVRVIRVG
ncbi:DUF523 domain-containing protein [Desulfatibacillum aliphaticivorans]|uniref:DUF523 domain-containing protein n=1 Tax=Desulfatibacillum aliphaticivorans TaxID=218208 RepID=UPI0001601152|nr:DUF523 domain-containing protein [Desulfatibacillum aliphaticivorans]